MIKDIISFTLGNEKYAVDILKMPLILSASKYLPKKYTLDKNGYFFQFEGKNVKIIDLHSFFSIDYNPISENSKILVGYFNNGIFGLLVNSVDKIINLNENVKKTNNFNTSVESNFIEQAINLSEETIIILNVDKIVSHSQKQEMEIN